MTGQNRSEAERHPTVTADDLLAWSHEAQAFNPWVEFVTETAAPVPGEVPAAAVLYEIPLRRRSDFVWLMDRLTQDGRAQDVRLKARYAKAWKSAYAMFEAALKETYRADLADIGDRAMGNYERNWRAETREIELERVWGHLVIGQLHAACVLLRHWRLQRLEEQHRPVMATGPR